MSQYTLGIYAKKGIEIAKLQQQGNTFAQKIEQGLGKLHDLDRQIAEQEQLLVQKRAEALKTSRKVDVEQKQRELEAKLQTIKQKQNIVDNQNNLLKQKIDEIRREKLLVKSIYSKIQNDIGDNKKDLQKSINSNHSYHFNLIRHLANPAG